MALLANTAFVGKVDTKMVCGGKPNYLKIRARTEGDVHRQHSCAHSDLTGPVLNGCTLRNWCAAHQPSEDFRQRIPEVVERWKSGKLV